MMNDFSEELNVKLQETQSVINKAFKDYSINQIFLSFNGGKDCTVLLQLLSDHLKDNISNFKIFYLRSTDPFPEIEQFVRSCETYYGIKIRTAQVDTTMKDVLSSICKEDEEIKAVFMGSRRSDPYCQNLEKFQQTDRGWPELMRINAIIDWTCENVWEFLLKKRVPYCSLYERGYTSIGNTRNTLPNPHLEIQGQPGKFLPAYELIDSTFERAGRS